MNNFSRLLKIGALVAFIGSSPFALSARLAPKAHRVEVSYQYALAHIEAFELDSAKAVLNEIVGWLEASGKLHSAFGMRVRLKKAETLEKNDEDEAAISQLLEVIANSEQQRYWAVYTDAQLSLARLHEKHERPTYCYKALQSAQIAIKERGLDPLYPRFATRMASYHRIFGQKATALFYAKAVIRTATDLNQREYLGNGHMLTGMLLKETAFEASAGHFKKAAEIFKSLGNRHGYSAMLCNLSSLHKTHQKLGLALEYSDAYRRTYNENHNNDTNDYWMLSNYYEIRSEIMDGLGRQDSAYHYLQLAFDSRLKLLQEENRKEVIEIEARFNDQQKAQKIEEQTQLLEYEATKLRRGIGIAILSLLFAGFTLLFYLKLKAANRKMRQQSILINEKNQELSKNLKQQIMLQGEIHHRVKNNLQVIISLLDLQRSEIHDPEALDRLESMSNRIYSMAAVHEMLYNKAGAETISFSAYVQQLCGHFRQIAPEGEAPIFNFDIDVPPLNLETLMPLGIVMNELITNSLKYGTIPNQPLEIDIHLQPCADGFCLEYRDNGPGFSGGAMEEREGGLGSYLIQSMARQLSGHLKTHNDNGAAYQIFFREKNQRNLQHEFISDTDRGR